MILLSGIPPETPLALVADALDRRGATWTMVNQRHVRDSSIRIAVDDRGVHGSVSTCGGRIDLDNVSGVYLRCMDVERLPKLAGEPPDGPVFTSAVSFYDIFGQWADLAPARVAIDIRRWRRTSPSRSNCN